MQCSRCQHDNPAGLKFCGECGARLALLCAACGAANAPTQKFCGECGAALTQGAPAARFASLEDYTPKHLAEKILNSRSALEGERKLVTVLFADLKGSMELLADSDPEEARKLLDPVLEHMMEAVHRYEGTVNQVMGDGIMALFGAPLALEDHAVRACYAALRMQESVKRYAEEVHRSRGIPLQIRIGLNSGEVVVRSIGSDLRMDYTAVGQTTHLAARMEQMAIPGSILIPPETLNLAEGYVQVKALGPRPVKGLDAPIEIYEVLGAETVRSRLHAAAARGLTRFVGRDAEMAQLYESQEQARHGHGQVVAVVGEPGVGKSRLYWEFTHSHRTQGWLILESGSVSYGKTTAYLPVIDLLKAYFPIENRDEARRIREKVIGKLLSLDRTLEASLAAHLSLLNVSPDDLQWERLDPSQRRQRTLDGIKRLLLRETQIQPVVLIFEDLHWIDAETQALLDSLVESLPTARLLLLVNYRPEYQHGWGSKTYYRQIRIDPLQQQGAEELLEALVGNDPGLPPLKRLLIEQTEGNPFFLEESVRTLAETGALGGERGAYRLLKPIEGLQIPATAKAILAARIDRLAPEDKRLLQAASVFGKNVPFTLLQAIADESEDGLRQRLSRLQTGEFLYEARLFPELEYTFQHALTHDVAYGSLLHDRRRALHARIVAAIETLFPDSLAEHVEWLAHHAYRGELWEKAPTYLREAGAKAFARSANRHAANCLEEALVALGHLPDTPDMVGQAVDVRLALRNALFPLGEFESCIRHLGDAQRLAETLGDQRRLAWIAAYMSEHSRMSGHARDARTYAEAAHAIAERLEDLPLRVAANYYLGTAAWTSGDYRGVGEWLGHIVQLLEGDLDRQRFGLAGFPAVMSRVFWVWALAERGEFEQGLVQAQDALRLAEALDHPYSVTFACRALGHLHCARGEFGNAVRLTERAYAMAREWNLAFVSPVVADLLGHTYALSGRIAEGLALLQQALKAMEAIGSVMFLSHTLVHVGEACMLADRLEDAREVADRGWSLASERGHRGAEAWALRLLGEIACARDPADTAAASGHYHRALALADQLGMRPLAAHCQFGLGKLARRSGQCAQADEHLACATRMYCELGMTYWLERAEAEFKTLA